MNQNLPYLPHQQMWESQWSLNFAFDFLLHVCESATRKKVCMCPCEENVMEKVHINNGNEIFWIFCPRRTFVGPSQGGMSCLSLFGLIVLIQATSATLNCSPVTSVVTSTWCNANCNHNPTFCPPNLCTCTSQPRCAGTVTYHLAFAGIWTPVIHPIAFLDAAKFSPLVIASHNEAFSLFKVGHIASRGLQDIAERGNTSKALEEFSLAQSQGKVGNFRSTGDGYIEPTPPPRPPSPPSPT